MTPDNLEQVLADTHIVFVKQMFQQGKYESHMQPVDYVVSSYGQPSRPVLWVSTQDQPFNVVQERLLRCVLEYAKEPNLHEYQKNDSYRYILEQYMMMYYDSDKVV